MVKRRNSVSTFRCRVIRSIHKFILVGDWTIIAYQEYLESSWKPYFPALYLFFDPGNIIIVVFGGKIVKTKQCVVYR